MANTAKTNPMASTTTDVLQNNWFELKDKVKQKWNKVTDDDIMMISGKREELLNVLQRRYGYDRVKAEQEINSFLTGR
jgi:uncharacterized protein YjbJ (UPF0337 family)